MPERTERPGLARHPYAVVREARAEAMAIDLVRHRRCHELRLLGAASGSPAPVRRRSSCTLSPAPEIPYLPRTDHHPIVSPCDLSDPQDLGQILYLLLGIEVL
jgi:hypothetical protein